MIKFLINLSAAIKRGILRIFPLTLKPCLYALAILTLLTAYSCATPRHVTQLVHDIQRDTIYISNVKHDSVYLNHERLIDRSKDTVYIKDISVEYKYHYLHDTVRVVQKDSIPYEVTIVETKEITRPLTFFDHLTRAIFWIVSTLLFVRLIQLMIKLKHPYSL